MISIITSQLLEVLIAKIVGHAVLVLSHDLPVILLRWRVVPRRRVEAHTGPNLRFFEVLADGLKDVLEVLSVVVVLGWLDVEVDLVAVLAVVVVEVVVGGDFVVDFAAQHQAGFVRPAACHVLDGVASAAEQDHRSAQALHEGEQFAVAADGQVEVAEFVLRERVGSALDDHYIGHVEGANAAHDLLEEFDIGLIVHAFAQRDVGGEELADAFAHFLQRAGAGEEVLFKLVEAYSENSVCMEEGLFDSVSVVHVDIEVEHPRVNLQQLKDAQDDVVDVAKSTGFRLLGVVIASGPIYHDISLTSDQQICGIDAPARSQPAKVIKPFEPRTIDRLVDLENRVELAIVPHLQLLLLGYRILLDYLFGLRRDPRLQILDIVRIVEGSHFL